MSQEAQSNIADKRLGFSFKKRLKISQIIRYARIKKKRLWRYSITNSAVEMALEAIKNSINIRMAMIPRNPSVQLAGLIGFSIVRLKIFSSFSS